MATCSFSFLSILTLIPLLILILFHVHPTSAAHPRLKCQLMKQVSRDGIRVPMIDPEDIKDPNEPGSVTRKLVMFAIETHNDCVGRSDRVNLLKITEAQKLGTVDDAPRPIAKLISTITIDLSKATIYTIKFEYIATGSGFRGLATVDVAFLDDNKTLLYFKANN